MDDAAAEFEDWELLDFPVVAAVNPPNPREFEGIGESFVPGPIEPDYFAPDHARVLSLEDDGSDEGGVDSDNPSSADPYSDSRYEVGFEGGVGFGSSGSSFSPKSIPDSEKGEIGNVLESSAIGEESGNRSSFGGFGTCHGSDAEVENRGLDEGRDDEVVDNRGLDERRDDDSEPSLAEIDAGNGSSEIAPVDGGEKQIAAWRKMPLVLTKYFAFRVNPLWSISVAAAVVGLVMLGRRMYKMNRKSRNIPLKIVIDDKRESLLVARAAHLNKAFSVVRQVPVIRASTRTVTPLSIISVR